MTQSLLNQKGGWGGVDRSNRIMAENIQDHIQQEGEKRH